jgi:hypothetical protein
MGMGWGGGEMWMWFLAFWQERQSRDHWLISVAMWGHTKRDEMRRRVARMPGWPREWKWRKICFWKDLGTRGWAVGVELVTNALLRLTLYYMHIDLYTVVGIVTQRYNGITNWPLPILFLNNN